MTSGKYFNSEFRASGKADNSAGKTQDLKGKNEAQKEGCVVSESASESTIYKNAVQPAGANKTVGIADLQRALREVNSTKEITKRDSSSSEEEIINTSGKSADDQIQ